ncbi:MAG TPA: hypothetical protein VFN24_07415, partial [Microbacterium sp.]|nr:hypothetical protein [Microbacterium sp.]
MNDTVAVCVLDRLGELTNEVDLGAKVEIGGVVCQPEVKSLVLGVVRKDEPAPEVVLDDVLRREDACMMEP